MSLYVGLFAGDSEIVGWVLGRYSDFGFFRGVISQHFASSQFPLLLGASDCDAVFTSEQLPHLESELRRLALELRRLPPAQMGDAFPHNSALWCSATNLGECFHNADGEPLVEAFVELCEQGAREGHILAFQ